MYLLSAYPLFQMPAVVGVCILTNRLVETKSSQKLN